MGNREVTGYGETGRGQTKKRFSHGASDMVGTIGVPTDFDGWRGFVPASKGDNAHELCFGSGRCVANA